jgi:acetoin utilization deacetylase AcuC-like enzyme
MGATGKTGFVYEDLYLQHKTGRGHPERPQRLEAIIARLEQTRLRDRLTPIKAAPAEEKWITAVHKPEYLERIQRVCRQKFGYVDTMDVPVSERSYDAALLAAGGLLAAVDAVVEGRVANAFCAVRPPGHHALSNLAMGFCLLNNLAIAARYLQKKHQLAKILIVDWDVHHGNGTQDTFYEDPTVFYFSTHQYPFYPGSGAAEETGRGEGRGFTLNVPLPAGRGDREYRQAFEDRLEPAAMAFDPDFVLISAGFDAHENDLLGQMNVTTEGFAELTRMVGRIADKCCDGRLAAVLEGGYELKGLAFSVEAHLRVLLG